MTTRFFNCSITACGRPSDRAVGRCDVCSSHLCTLHLSPSSHKCNEVLDDAAYISQIVAEIDRLRLQINDAAVCKLASTLNDFRDCSLEHFSKVGPGALMGSANYHARIRFHDGSRSWLLRVPRVAGFSVGLPDSLASYLIQSEYATLKFLETTAVPAPKAFTYGIRGSGTDYGVGVSFLLMEELPGTPWLGDGPGGGLATEEEKSKVRGSVADILGELSKYPFLKAGSLCFPPCESSNVEVSAVASDRFVVLTPAGPFESALEYYTAFSEQYLELIADGQLYRAYPVNAYLVYRFLKDNAAQLVQKDAEGQTHEQFFLKHVDDKGDHLLVDDHLNVTGIIDWQMARVVPANEAFGPSLVTADMDALCGGKVSLTADDVALAGALEEKGYPKLARRMTAGEQVRRFFWGLAIETEWKYALPLATAILSTFGVDQDWTQWREAALKEYAADERLQRMLLSQSD